MSPCLSIRHNGQTIDDHEKTSISIVQTTDMIEMTVTTYTTTTPTMTTTTNAEPPNKTVLSQSASVPLRTSIQDHHPIAGNSLGLHAPLTAHNSNKPHASSGDANQSLNTLMLSTSVPIKIGSRIDNIDREPNHKSNRIRYTFGLNTRKKTTNAATTVAAATTTITNPTNIDASRHTNAMHNHKSMESIYSMTADAQKVPSTTDPTSIVSLADNVPNASMDVNGKIDSKQTMHKFLVNRSQSSTVFVTNMNDRGSKLVKQTSIDYYV